MLAARIQELRENMPVFKALASITGLNGKS
jgi:hypothetical protein